MGISNIGGDQTSEFLLSSSIPQLQPVNQSVVDNVLHDKVNSDSLLNSNTFTPLSSSNLFWEKRSMMADLPTELDPKKTILYLTSHNFVDSSNIARNSEILKYYSRNSYLKKSTIKLTPQKSENHQKKRQAVLNPQKAPSKPQFPSYCFLHS